MTMKADEFVALSRHAVEQLLAQRASTRIAAPDGRPERRRHARWAFPAQVELWLAQPDGHEEHLLATCHDLSVGGVGVSCDRDLPIGLTIPIAIHQPEVTFHGHAIVRRCMRGPGGYLVGLEFPEEGK